VLDALSRRECARSAQPSCRRVAEFDYLHHRSRHLAFDNKYVPSASTAALAEIGEGM